MFFNQFMHHNLSIFDIFAIYCHRKATHYHIVLSPYMYVSLWVTFKYMCEEFIVGKKCTSIQIAVRDIANVPVN